MKDEFKYIQDKPFYYQIGEVTTIVPWWRPNYDRLYKYLTQDEVTEIFSKYADVEIIGNVLWDFDVTWDMDLRIILPDSFVCDEKGWNSLEDDLNRLNYLALNEWRILPDIGVTRDRHQLPTKSEILSSFHDEEKGYLCPLHESSFIKIAYTKKVVNDKMFENDIRNSPYYVSSPLTNRYLTAYFPKFHTKKIIDKILNSKKEVLENSVNIQTFLEMGEDEFIKFQNY